MSNTERARPKIGWQTRTTDFWERVKEIDLFFEGRSREYQTLRRLARLLKKADIPYVIVGGMAVNAHGARRTTGDVDVLLNREGFDRFRQELLGTAFDPVAARPRRFVDKKNGVTVDVLVTGRFPGSGAPGPIGFPEPEAAGQEIGKIRFLTLPQLIQLKLAARRHSDFGDVVFLIRVHELGEAFADQLHPSVRSDFIECLEEKRREDEYEARE